MNRRNFFRSLLTSGAASLVVTVPTLTEAAQHAITVEEHQRIHPQGCSPLMEMMLPVGSIVPMPDSTAPHRKAMVVDGGYLLSLQPHGPERWMSVKQFPQLFSVIGFTYGRATAAEHSGGYMDNGPRFKLPDLRLTH